MNYVTEDQMTDTKQADVLHKFEFQINLAVLLEITWQ